MIKLRGAISLIICLATAVAIAGCIGTNLTMEPGDSLSATLPAATPFNTEAIRQEIIRATNEERAKDGLPTLRVDSTLMEVAQQRAREVSADFDHYGYEGEVRAAAIATGLGYSGQVGENCALRQFIPTTSGPTGAELTQGVMAGWMSSSGHRTNILLERYSALGVGVYETEYRLYVVQVFGTQ